MRVLKSAPFGIADKHAVAALSLAAVVSVTPALAAPMQSISAVRPIVAREHPVDDIQIFMGQFAVEPSTAERNFPERIFMSADQATLTTGPPQVNPPAAVDRTIIVADADPYFERWQKDADERLKSEHDFITPKQHPLAAAEPDKSVVVCVAGCETTKDVVVYSAAVVPAVLPAAQLEVSGSGAAVLDEGSLPCIAGCYDQAEPSRAQKRQRAALQDHAPVHSATAVTTAAIQPAASQLHTRTAAAIMPRRALRRLALIVRGHAVTNQLHRAHLALAKPLKYRNQAAYNGAIVEQHHEVPPGATRSANLRHRALVRSPVELKASVLHAWRTKVVAAALAASTSASPAAKRRSLEQQAVRRPKHFQRHETYASFDMF